MSPENNSWSVLAAAQALTSSFPVRVSWQSFSLHSFSLHSFKFIYYTPRVAWVIRESGNDHGDLPSWRTCMNSTRPRPIPNPVPTDDPRLMRASKWRKLEDHGKMAETRGRAGQDRCALDQAGVMFCFEAG